MDAYTLHLAMAALVGASFVAVSAYYMHRKTLNQLLELAKTVERERERDDDSEGESPQHLRRRRGGVRRRGSGYRRASASLPDVTAMSSGGMDGEERCNGPMALDGIPPGLPRLQTLHEGMTGRSVDLFLFADARAIGAPFFRLLTDSGYFFLIEKAMIK